MRKKIVAMMVIVCMTASLTACAGSSTPEETPTEAAATEAAPAAETMAQPAAAEETETEAEEPLEDDVENEEWDELAALGNVQTENGILFVTITMPAEFVGEGVTQESLAQRAGEGYLSAVLNEDGSVTYKMTKIQHKAMLKELVNGFDESFRELIDGEEYSFTEIKYNKDFTEFDVTISGKELTFGDTFATLVFYMTGGMYGIFTGKTPEKVIVNFYNAKGELVETADSSKME